MEYKFSDNRKAINFVDNKKCNMPPRDASVSRTQRKYIERHLFCEHKEFLIAPNGGTGDCCFKAIAQAIEGTELGHHKIREEVVNFVINHRWDKFKESIEVQHVHGNQFLQKSWKTEPIETYKNYMNTLGTLGSSTELNAAGELFHYNFVTIQEYSDPTRTTYRVENCCPFSADPSAPFHYFYFTGDFDNGHWEYLEPRHLPGKTTTETIPDGLYTGTVKVIIDGVETTVDEWFKIHTHNTNDEFHLKHSMTRYLSKRSPHPFESEEFNYNEDGCVILKGLPFRISKFRGTDIFSVLLGAIFPEQNQNDVTILDRFEDQIVDYRVGNISLLNYKLITQPHSHGFDIGTLKHVGMVCKGNIQDLLAAADLFGFSFEIFIKPGPLEPIRSCRFVHVDRWGGETERILFFMMRLTTGPGPLHGMMAKWWHLIPRFENKTNSESNNNTGQSRFQKGDVSGENVNQIRRNSASGNSRVSSKKEVSLSESGDDDGEIGRKSSASSLSSSSSRRNTDDEEEILVKDTLMNPNSITRTQTESDSDSYEEEQNQNTTTNTRNFNHGSRTAMRNTNNNTPRKSGVKSLLTSEKVKAHRHNQSKRHSASRDVENYTKKKRGRNNGHMDGESEFTENVQNMKRYEERPVNGIQIKKDQQEISQTSDKESAEEHRKTPKIQTQVFVYDDVTDKKREYRFSGVKTREEVLNKLLERGYIKRIPTVVSNSQLGKNENDETFSNRSGQPLKCDSVIMKAAENYKNEMNKNESECSVHETGKIGLSPVASKVSSTRVKSPLSNYRLDLSDQHLNNKSDRLNKRSWLNLFLLPRPKSASAVALADQDSLERNNTFLTMHHKVSPWAQRKAEETLNEPKQKNFLRRIVSWITSLFQTCKKARRYHPV